MGNKFWGGIATLAAVVAGVGAAGAADLAPVYKAPPPVILHGWEGFYLGVHGGYGWSDTKGDDLFNAFGLFGDAKSKGGVFGGHAGYNWQYGHVVTGLEIDFDGADIKGTDKASGLKCEPPVPNELPICAKVSASRTIKFDELATARARLGYALLPDLLAYGTAGIAWGHSRLTVDNVDANANNFGWVAGGGLEYHLGHGFIVRGEYLHYDFAKTAYSFPVLISPNAGNTIDVVRGGLSYKF